MNLVIVVVTVLAWLLSKESKLPQRNIALAGMVLFFLWMTFNSFFAVEPAWSWPLWDRNWKIIILGIFVVIMATNKVRTQSVVWIVVISLMYYGIKGGIYTISTGGSGHVMGPESSQIGDNNQLAVALIMILPLANYLRRHTANRWIGIGLLGGMALTAAAILGTYSRGGLVTLLGLAVVAWLRVRNRIIYPIAAAVVLVPIMLMMPQSYDDRISTIATIESAQNDGSFHGRVVAWEVAWHYAVDHFPMGNGFSGSERPEIFNRYFPKEDTHAAHSIFFEVLGDTGFAGLAIYLVIMASAFFNCSRVKRLARGRPELEWAFDLADMMQLSLFAFCLGGSALSLAYYDVFFIWVGLSQALYLYVVKQLPEGAKVKRRSFEGVAGSDRVSYAKRRALATRE
jgi:probable O-glycosylation ligase (exosortase A-associated)